MPRITQNNIKELQEKLIEWDKSNGRKFFWRNKGLSNYQIIIAETLLQRTKAETVAKFYSQFIMDFQNWESLANSDLKTLEEYLKPIGLFRQRALRLQSLATEMLKRKGKLPKNRKELESIPFLGQYIANSIELIIFKQPSPLIDVNMARVLERYFGERKMADIRYDPYLQKLCYKVVKHPDPKKINWAILDFAALVCKARKPVCSICPISVKCKYFKKLKNTTDLEGKVNLKH